jgi:hypothetical protein
LPRLCGARLPPAATAPHSPAWREGDRGAGRPATQACQGGGGIQACNASIGGLHLRQLITYQPDSRYWAFQWYETAIFVALALLLVWFCYWRVSRRRLT